MQRRKWAGDTLKSDIEGNVNAGVHKRSGSGGRVCLGLLAAAISFVAAVVATLLWVVRTDAADTGLFCSGPLFVTVVLPSVVNPELRGDRLMAIADTWGKEAHALFVVHSWDGYANKWPLIEAGHRAPCENYNYPCVVAQSSSNSTTACIAGEN